MPGAALSDDGVQLADVAETERSQERARAWTVPSPGARALRRWPRPATGRRGRCGWPRPPWRAPGSGPCARAETPGSVGKSHRGIDQGLQAQAGHQRGHQRPARRRPPGPARRKPPSNGQARAILASLKVPPGFWANWDFRHHNRRRSGGLSRGWASPRPVIRPCSQAKLYSVRQSSNRTGRRSQPGGPGATAGRRWPRRRPCRARRCRPSRPSRCSTRWLEVWRKAGPVRPTAAW